MIQNKNAEIRHWASKAAQVVVGNLFYACGVNLAINPLHFYSGGFTGIAQLLRLFLLNVVHIPQINIKTGFRYKPVQRFQQVIGQPLRQVKAQN